ncbi:MAG: hypothetical protein V7K27_35665 [Nostoc sp.]|uniref:hypothetical protein n=1 Tax=Nostoc sp. TaxID=1180 RepID=UPI002FF49986
MLIRISSDRQGKWFASCNHPFDLESKEYDSEEEAIDELRRLIDAELDKENEPLTQEELDAYEESVSCWDCAGTGKIYAYIGDSQPGRCSTCKGTGYL